VPGVVLASDFLADAALNPASPVRKVLALLAYGSVCTYERRLRAAEYDAMQAARDERGGGEIHMPPHRREQSDLVRELGDAAPTDYWFALYQPLLEDARDAIDRERGHDTRVWELADRTAWLRLDDAALQIAGRAPIAVAAADRAAERMLGLPAHVLSAARAVDGDEALIVVSNVPALLERRPGVLRSYVPDAGITTLAALRTDPPWGSAFDVNAIDVDAYYRI
jgi:hypothetical protein